MASREKTGGGRKGRGTGGSPGVEGMEMRKKKYTTREEMREKKTKGRNGGRK